MIARRPAGFIPPCLPSKGVRPPPGPISVHEIKHDRLMVRRDGSRIRCFTRNSHDWADRTTATTFNLELNPQHAELPAGAKSGRLTHWYY